MANIFKTVIGCAKNNAPSILTGGSVLGLFATTVLAVAATPKALDILLDEGENVTPMEAVKLTWHCYIPTIVIGGLTVASMIWSNRISFARTATLASVYSLSETKLKRYQKALLDRMGPKKAREVSDHIAKEKLHANPIVDETLVVSTGHGDTLCYDALSGRYFRSDIDIIKRAIGKLARDMLSDTFITLNEIYNEIGLSSTKMGEHIGWHIDDGYMDPYFSSHLNEKDQLCLVLDFEVDPRYFSGY
jgi:hypothetical protein